MTGHLLLSGRMPLRLRVLGEFDASDEAGRPVAVAAKKNRALLAALALAPGCTMRRQRIGRLLWSDRDETQARSSLRQALVALREDLADSGSKAFSFVEDRVTLDPSKVEVDALEFARLAGADDIMRLRLAAELYRGELLADTEIKDREFETWVAGERQRLTDLAVSVLDKLRALESGVARVNVARHLVAIDPWREESHLKLMIALAETGERVAALRQYDICRETLETELNAVPGKEIEALHRRLLNGTMDRIASSKEATSSIDTVLESSPGILKAGPVLQEDSPTRSPQLRSCHSTPWATSRSRLFATG